MIPQKSRSSAFAQSKERLQSLLPCPQGRASGLSTKKIGDNIAKATQEWKGLKVTVRLTIQNHQAKVNVVPSAAAWIIKALKEPPKSGTAWPASKSLPGPAETHEKWEKFTKDQLGNYL